MVRQVVIPKSFLALHHDVHIFSPTCAATVPDCLDRARPVIEKARVLLPGHRHCYGSICAGAQLGCGLSRRGGRRKRLRCCWRRRQLLGAPLPSGWKDWIFTAVFIAIGGCGVARSASILTGRVPQADTEVDLAFPLNGGTFLVVNGGSHINVNTHLMTLDASMTRFHKYRGQSMAWASSKSMHGEFAQRACSQGNLVRTRITG